MKHSLCDNQVLDAVKEIKCRRWYSFFSHSNLTALFQAWERVVMWHYMFWLAHVHFVVLWIMAPFWVARDLSRPLHKWTALPCSCLKSWPRAISLLADRISLLVKIYQDNNVDQDRRSKLLPSTKAFAPDYIVNCSWSTSIPEDRHILFFSCECPTNLTPYMHRCFTLFHLWPTIFFST